MLHQVSLASFFLGETGLTEVVLFGAGLSLDLTRTVSGLKHWNGISSLIEVKLRMRLMHRMNLLGERRLCLTKRIVLRILWKTANTVLCTARVFVVTAIRIHHLLLLLLHVTSLTQSHLLEIFQFWYHHLRWILAHIADCKRIALDGHRSKMRSSREPKWQTRIRVWSLIHQIVGCFEGRSVAVLRHVTWRLNWSHVRAGFLVLLQFGSAAQFFKECRISLSCSTYFFLRSDLQ